MSNTEQALLAEVAAMCADARWKKAILVHAAGIDATAALARFNADIHARDQMLLHSLRHHRDAGAAFSQYFGIALQQYASARQILHLLFGNEAASLDVLDFACGYGRLLRFLSLAMPPSRVWASELQTDAVAFVRQAFDVNVCASHTDPAQFAPGCQFDFIWVASLFSHLPESLFHSWLAKLISLLTPTGVLCFSVRDMALLPAGVARPASGFTYVRASENADLDTEIYGTTYADEAFARRAVRAATGDARAVHRLPKALAHEQDLYLVAADPQSDLSVLDTFRRGPWGWVDRRVRSPEGRLLLQGWAASLDDGAIDHVEVIVGDRLYRCATGIARPDVAAAFADERLAAAGWQFECDIDAGVDALPLVVSAHTSRGESALLYAGDVRAGN